MIEVTKIEPPQNSTSSFVQCIKSHVKLILASDLYSNLISVHGMISGKNVANSRNKGIIKNNFKYI